MNLTGQSLFTPVVLHGNMSIEMTKGTVAFCTASPRAVIQMLNLIVMVVWTLSDCISKSQ